MEVVRIEPELLFSLQVQALSTAQPGGNEQVNCTVVYLSNIFNEKIRPRGLTTPTPALAVGDSTTEPGFGYVTVVQPSQRGLFSFASQSQVANTAVLNNELISVMLTHQVVLSDGAIFQPDSVECTSDSTAFQLTSSCDQIVLNGTEPFGTNRGDVIVTYQNLSAVVSLRVWYPSLPADVQLSTETLRPIEGWLAAGRDGQCSQQYQQASLDVFTNFTYDGSEYFTVSILPLVASFINTSDLTVATLSDDASTITAHSGGEVSIVPSTDSLFTPVSITVSNETVTPSSLIVTLFSGLSVSIPPSPYPQLSSQTASAVLNQTFPSLNTPVFLSLLLTLSNGDTMLLDGNQNAQTPIEVLATDVATVIDDEILLLGEGSGDLVQVSLVSPCTGLSVISGNGSAEVAVTTAMPSPVRVDISQSASRLTYPGDVAASGGVPTSVSVSVTLVFPDGANRDVTDDPLTTYTVLTGGDLVSLDRTETAVLITPSDTSSSAFGSVLIQVHFQNLLTTNLSLDVVVYRAIQLYSRPFPTYPGSELVNKSTLFLFENTEIYQQAALELEAILSDDSTVSVTQSPLTIFLTTSPSLSISGHIVTASAPGVFLVQGRLGSDVSAISLEVSNTPVSITALEDFSLMIPGNTLTGTRGTRASLGLDVVFSDMTEYPEFIPTAVDLIPHFLTLTVDTPSAVSLNPLTGLVVLQDNHHSNVTITASANGASQQQLSFACNLQPAIGDVDLGETDGVPIPSPNVNDVASVPLVVNAGSQRLAAAQLTITYSSAVLDVVGVRESSEWPGTLQHTDSPGVLTITASGGSVSGLVHLATLELRPISAGVGTIGGIVLRLTDTSGNAIGSGQFRSILAGAVTVQVSSPGRSRREVEQPHVRERRNAQCLFPPCGVCLDSRQTGDVDGDCVFTADDVQVLLQYHADMLNLSLVADMDPEELDFDLNTAVDPQDVYFLHQVQTGLLHFLRSVDIEPIQDSPACQLVFNATLSARGDTLPNASHTAVFFDLALSFDPTLTSQSQALLDASNVVVGSLTSVNKGLLLPGGIFEACEVEPGLYSVVLETNLTVSDVGLSVIQVTTQDGTSTNQARTRAMFGSPDPPYAHNSPLMVSLPAFSDTVTLRASGGYTSFVLFNNTMSTLACITPPGRPIIEQPLVSAQVFENVSIGSEVAIIMAVSQSDRDVTYSLVSGQGSSDFSIGVLDGIIRTTRALDYEAAQFISLQVLATDPATGFASSATAEITLLDVNDNAPVFDQFQADIALPANTPPGAIVTTVSAQDTDEGINAQVVYTVQGNAFAIGSISGRITLEQALDFDTQNMYTVLVMATDMGDPPLSTLATLNITVLPPDPTLLQFSSSAYNTSLTENSPVGSEILRLTASPVNQSEQAEAIQIGYAIQSPLGVPFELNTTSGVLSVSGGIDRELVSLYELMVTATALNTDRAISAFAFVTVSVLDMNDNAPVFEEEEYRIMTQEETPPGTVSLNVTASDADEGDNRVLRYSFLEQSNLFSIDEATGVLSNTRLLDYEADPVILLTVVATDMGTPPISSLVNISVILTDVNDNPPSLILMPDTVVVNESVDIGSVLSVAVYTDPDSDLVNGPITLSLLSSESNTPTSQFSIDPSTGEITSLIPFDYEIAQQYDLIVVASDSGSPPLSSSQNLTVLISDVNDNPPVFAQDRYNITLREDTQVPSTLLTLVVTDADSGSNADVEFSVVSIDPLTDIFALNGENGSLGLVGSLDFEQTQAYDIVIMVENTEPGTTPVVALVHIDVTNVNEFAPVFSRDVYEASVTEEVLGARVIQVLVNDSDMDNVLLSLDNDNFSVDGSGVIVTSVALDREMEGQYNITVTATDEGGRQSSALVMVDVLDINDNSPTFDPFQNLSILESTPVGTLLRVFSASDLDIGSNGDIESFSLITPTTDFSVTPDGQLSVSSILNASRTSLYLLTIQVQDGGDTPLTSTADILIEVSPSPLPVFEQSVYVATITENNLPGEFLVRVRAVTQNLETTIRRYRLITDSSSQLFSVGEVSGNVTASVSLDREEEVMYSLEVEVEADFNSTTLIATALVNISVLDLNDNAPQFSTPELTIMVNETLSPGTEITAFEAMDIDSDINAVINYAIVSGNEELQLAIDQNGLVSTTLPLLGRSGEYNISILASNPPESGPLSSTALLTLEIIPVNNFAPMFDMDMYDIIVTEDAPVGLVLLTAPAADSDMGSAGEVSYSILSATDVNQFVIDSNTSNISLAQPLDFESQVTSYNLTVQAVDDGDPALSATALVVVQVTDVNDNPPIFSQGVYNGSLDENLPSGQSILSVVVTDADSPANSIVTYSIVSSPTSGLFQITSSGILQNSQPLDRENLDSPIMLTITASNAGSGVTFTATAVAMVTVTDMNDNAPLFVGAPYSRVLQAPVEANTSVVTGIQVRDADSLPENTQVQFSVQDPSDTFDIDSASGVIRNRVEISEGGNFTFNVTATDVGAPSLSSQAQVSVTILAPNDLTAGRERDFTFTTQPGLSLVRAAERTMSRCSGIDSGDSYSQLYGFTLGRDPRQSRTISASLGSLSSQPLSVSLSDTRVTSVKAVLISQEIWHDAPTLTLVVQARDSTHNVHVSGDISAQAAHPSLGTARGSCRTRTSDGTCTIRISIPATWFTNTANVTVTFGRNFAPMQTLGIAEVQQQPTFDVGTNVYSYMEMPLRTLFVGNTFSVPVHGRTGTKGVGSYTMTVRASSDVEVTGLSVDSNIWSSQVQTGSDGSRTITAVRSDQTTTPPAEDIVLFTIQARVAQSSTLDTLIASAITTFVVELSDFDRVRLLPSSGETPVLASALSRNGITQAGAVYVARDAVVGILPYVDSAELVNTALLNGGTVIQPIFSVNVLRSGSSSVVTSAAQPSPVCSSASPMIVSVGGDCSNVLLTANQTMASPSTTISVSHNDQSNSFSVRIWVPQFPVRLIVDDSTLQVMSNVPDSQSNCSSLRQSGEISAFTSFTTTQESVSDVDVTSLVSGSLSSSDNSIATLTGNMIQGRQAGTVTVQASSSVPELSFTELSVSVVEDTVELLGLDVRVYTALVRCGPDDVMRLDTNRLLITPQQVFDFEGVEGTAIATAIFSDGGRLVLDQSQVSFSSLDTNIVRVSGSTVTALGSGRGELVRAEWTAPAECATDFIARGEAEVSVDIPRPDSVVVTLSSPVLTAPGSTASSIGVSTSSTLRVVAMYSDRMQDLSGDSRTIYDIPSNVDLTVSGNTVTIATNSNATATGDFTIMVSFSQFQGLTQNVSFTIVSLSDISLQANPFPTYPNSNLNNVRTLSNLPTSDPRQRQQAIVLATAVLSNADTIDISSNSELVLGLMASRTDLQNSATIERIQVGNILRFSDGFPFGTLTISATLREVVSSSPLVLDISSNTVQITDIRILAFPSQNTFRGIVDQTQRQVVVDVTFDDSTQYIGLFRDTMLMGVVSFSATPTSAVTIDPNTGVATLRGNLPSLATIRVTSASSVSATLEFACNLDPDVGDVDLGSQTGIAIPAFSSPTQITVPVIVNSGTNVLDSIELDIEFDPTILRAVSATQGDDWPTTGQFLPTLNDPVDVVTVGGTLVGSTPVSGTSLHLATIVFEAVGTGLTNITGTVHTLARQNIGGVAENIGIVPRGFIAGSIQVGVTASRRRRGADDYVHDSERIRRQTGSTCSSPPCAVCPSQRETGDVDGNCVFDVRDVSFLQLYYLTTITQGQAPPLTQDRAQFLDADLSGRVDANDVVFMLRVNFRLLRFVSEPVIALVDAFNEICELAINISLVHGGDAPADTSNTALIFDIAHESPDFQAAFDASNFTSGTVIPVSKGANLYGGLVLAEYLGDGIYGIRAESALAGMLFGVSPIQVTFDALGSTSVSRTAAMFSSTVPRYGMLDSSVSLRGQSVSIGTQLGYAPLRLVNSMLSTPECLLLQSPLMFVNLPYSASVNESASPGDFVLTVAATSNRPFVSLSYNIIGVSDALPFAMNSSSGVLTVAGVLDFETVPSYSFQVLASELSANNEVVTATAEVTVSITNINDLPPLISPLSLVTSVLASQTVGEQVLNVSASDPDNLDTLAYSTSSPSLFSIDSAGVVSIADLLMPSANTLLNLTITVSDSLFSSTAEVTIDIYLPSFSQQTYFANVSEQAPVGSPVASLALVNTREDEFEFESQDDNFMVTQTGQVLVNSSLDYETQQSHIVTVIGNSLDLQIATTLVVNVTDENDNAPVFDEPDYNISLPVSTGVGTSVLQVQATDADSPGPNSDISYFLVPSSDSEEFFGISEDTGQLSLARNLFRGPSIVVLNVTASDNGSPSLTESVTVTIVIESTGIPEFPVPPAVQAMGGLLVQSGPSRTTGSDGEVVFQQAYTKLSGSFTSRIAASFAGSNIEGSAEISAARLVASVATAHILHPSLIVYQDGRDVAVSFQVRDPNHLTQVSDTSVAAQATLAGTDRPPVSVTCTPHLTFGWCVAVLSIPENWFNDTSTTMLFQTSLNGESLSSNALTLQPSPTLSETISNNILVECPSRDIVSGQSFTLRVYGYSTFSISGFSLVFTTQSPLTITAHNIDPTRWSVQTANSTGRFAISAILSSPGNSDGMIADRTLLFTLQVLTTPGLSSAVPASISAEIQSLSNTVEGTTVLGDTGNTTGPALFLSRDGQGLSGVLYVVPNSVLAVYPYVQQTELVNTAPLTGTPLSLPVQLFAGYVSGNVLPYTGDVQCSSDMPHVLSTTSDCYTVVLTGTETSGSDLVAITYAIDTASGMLPLRVYHPQALVFTSTDDTLNQIRYSNDCMVYQQAILTVHTDFNASSEYLIQDVLVTDLVLPHLTSTSDSVLTVSGDRVQGQSAGTAAVCAIVRGSTLGCTVLTVSDEPVEISGLAGSVLIDVSIMSDPSENLTGVASIIPRSRFEFEQEQGTLLVAVQFSDGVISAVNSSDITILPSNSTLYSVQNNVLLPRDSGEAVGTFSWRPQAGVCNLDIIDFFLLSSSLPAPSTILTSLLPTPEVHVLTTPTDPASLVGTPTSLVLAVTVVFEGGQSLDVSTDPRVRYLSEGGVISVMDNVVTTDTSSSGLVQLTVQFSSASGEVLLNTTIDILIVLSTGVTLTAHPYPAYPGSTDVATAMLSPIEDTGVWERAVLEMNLQLSNGTVVEITSLSEASFQASTFTGTVMVDISSAIISVVEGIGIVQITGSLLTVTSNSIFISVDIVPVVVTDITVVPLPASTLRGVTGNTAHQLAVDMTLSDNTQLLSYPTNPAFISYLLPGVLAYNTSSSDFTVDSSGLLTPISNSHGLATVEVSAGSTPVNSTGSFVVNLDPDIGDVDIGMGTGPPATAPQVGNEVVLPVVVNTGNSNLGSLDVMLTYDPTIFTPLEVSTGPDFPAGIFESRINDPPGEIRFGGALSADISGSTLHLFNIRVRFVGVTDAGFIRGTVLTFAERNLAGTAIGPPTPRPVVAGNITFTVSGSRKRSAPDVPSSPSQPRSRARRQALCPTPPCPCSGEMLGDTDGNCVFDIRDVSFTLLYVTQGLLSSQQQAQITTEQREQLDPNQDGAVDTSDAFFLLRALFRLVYFLESVSVSPVQAPNSQCLFSVEVQLRAPEGEALGEVEVLIDVGFQDDASNKDFIGSVLVTGELLTADKGASLNGGVILSQRISGSLFRAEMNASFVSNDIGISVVIATFDAQNATSSSRSVQFFGRPPFLYPFPLRLDVPVRGTEVLIAATSGYSPFVSTSNTLVSEQCSDLPLLEPNLDVVFVSPFQAELSWMLQNMRMELNVSSALTLIITSCEVDQTGTVRNETCEGPVNMGVANHTSHTLVTTPFTAYYLQITAPTSSTDTVGVVSPRSPAQRSRNTKFHRQNGQS